jgi:hypothetical protein
VLIEFNYDKLSYVFDTWSILLSFLKLIKNETYFSVCVFVVNQSRVLSGQVSFVVDLGALIGPFLGNPGQLGIPLLKLKVKQFKIC